LGRPGVSRFLGEVSMKTKIHEIRAGLSGASLNSRRGVPARLAAGPDKQIVAEMAAGADLGGPGSLRQQR